MALSATLSFIARDVLHETEKPYELEYEPPDGIEKSNYTIEQIDGVQLHDIRPWKGNLSLDREGFIVSDLHSSLHNEEFWDEQKLKTVFAEELRSHLIRILGARAIYFHECVVSALVCVVEQAD